MQGKLIYSSDCIPGVRVYQAFQSRDARGAFVKTLEPGFLRDPNVRFGEIYLVSAEKAVVRACHYHLLATEYFSVIVGKGKLTLKYKGQSEEFQMDASEPTVVVIPPGVFHKIEGVSDVTMHLLAYSDMPYDLNSTDTYSGENDE